MIVFYGVDVIQQLRDVHGTPRCHLFLRSSMEKFEGSSSYNCIDVLNISRTHPGNLNISIMFGLVSNGIEPSKIIRHLNNFLDNKELRWSEQF